MSGFSMSPQHDQLRERVRRWAETEVRPQIAAMEESKTVAYELPRRIGENGWIGATICRCYGGMGLGHLAKTIIIEELSRVSAAVGAAAQASMLGAAKIIHFGNDLQRRSWLPAIARGACLPTIAVTEHASGGDVLDMRTTAVRDGEDYIVNGRKTYVGNSHIGDLHGVVARTGGTGSKALSAFLVESTRPGLSVAPHRPAMGLHGFSFGEIIFTDCRIPAANRLGAEGDGLAVAYSSSVLYGRPNLAAVALGIHRAVLEETTAYAAGQRRSGKPLADVGVNKQRLGQIKSGEMTARLCLYQAAYLLDRGLPCDAELFNAKVKGAQLLEQSASDAMKVHGACGLFPDRPIERLFRDTQHIFAPAGTSDIQLLRLGDIALGTEDRQWSHRFAAPTHLDHIETTNTGEGKADAGQADAVSSRPAAS
jgi:alkylation response protein AidB-like acyl-CoA dehydrogenase